MNNAMRWAQWALWLSAAVGAAGALAGCSDSGPSPAPSIPDGGGALESMEQHGDADTSVSEPIDLGGGGLKDVMRRAHFAYRAVRGSPDLGFEAAHRTYSVRVAPEPGAAIEVTPYGPPTVDEDGNEAAPAQGEPLMLDTFMIARAGARLDVDHGRPRVVNDGHLVIDRAPASEHWSNSETGVQQSWQFEAKPTGSGDLTIRVHVSGLPYAGKTSKGLHFAKTQPGLGFSYGHGTWIDGQGQRFDIESTWTGSEIELRVPATVVEASTYPAVLDPVLSTEIGFDSPVIGPADENQTATAVAAGSSEYLVVWTDARAPGRGTDIFGALVTIVGTVTPEAGIEISAAAGNQYDPAVSFASSTGNYLVTWSDPRNGGSDIYGARVAAANGTVLDPDGIEIASGAASQLKSDVSCTPTNCLVAYNEGTDIYGTQVLGSSGSVLTFTRTALANGSYSQKAPKLAYNSGDTAPRWVMVYEDDASFTDDVKARWISVTNMSLTSIVNVATGSSFQSKPAVTYLGSGSSNYAVWEEYVSSSQRDLKGAAFSAAGVVAGSEIVIASGSGNQWNGQVGGLAFGKTVVWEDNSTGVSKAYAQSVSSTNKLSGSPVLLSQGTAGAYEPSVACFSSGGTCVAAWNTTQPFADTNIYGAGLVSGSLSYGPFLISRAANLQGSTSSSFDGTNFLVVWEDNRNAATTGWDIFGARVDTSGHILDPNGIVVSAATGEQTSPDVAFDGSNHLVAWEDGRNTVNGLDIYAARVSPSGTVLDTSGIAVATAALAQSNPAVAGGGTNSLISWQDYRASAQYKVYTTRVSPSGAVLDGAGTGVKICSGTGNQRAPDVAYAGDNYVVVWQDERAGVANPDIFAARVSPSNGAVISGDAAGIQVNSSTYRSYGPAIAYDGTTNLLVVWEDYDLTQRDIRGTRISKTLSVLDGLATGVAITTDSANQTEPAVGFDGYNYLVTWTDSRAAATTFSDIYGTYISPTFTILQTNGFAISKVDTPELTPSVSFADTGLGLVAFQRFDSSTNANSFRVKARFVRSTARILGDSCTSGSTCVSNLCVNGRCCNTACSGACDVCSTALGAARDGFCGNAPATYEGSPSCGAYLCSGTAPPCPTSCTVDSRCAADYYCAANGTCQARKPQAGVCDTAVGADCKVAGCRVCASAGGCVDGYCCDAACSADCDVCSVAKGASVNGTCSLAPPTFAGEASCGAYLCSGTNASCPTSCTNDAGCAAGYYCGNGNTCQPQKLQGSACSPVAGVDCLQAGCRVCTTPGGCVDGFCCDKACNQVCDACSAALSTGPNGTCSPTKAGTAACGGGVLCDGVNPVCPTTCANDTECGAAYYCGTDNKCHARSVQGDPCSPTVKCLTGLYCVDDVCCQTACNDVCMSCNAAYKESGVSGECGFAKANSDHRGDCPLGDPTACGTTGECNGQGACKYFGSEQSCLTPICEGNVSKGRHCDGVAGGIDHCLVDGSGSDCQLNRCASGLPCPTTCAADSECVATAYCDNTGHCAEKLAGGETCTRTGECATGFCTDGVCCNGACAGTCQACNQAGAVGTCTPYGPSSDPEDECTAGLPSTCGLSGTCSGFSSCGYYPATQQCSASCSNGNLTRTMCDDGAHTCNGSSTTTPCPGGLACLNTSACRTDCYSDSDCIASYWCDTASHTCVPDLDVGLSCSRVGQCPGDQCADGVCCAQPCTATCHACSAAKKGSGVDGECAPIADNSDPDDECQVSSTPCGTDGMCNGQGACRLTAEGTSCGPSSCVGNTVYGQICSGNGTCAANTQGIDCSPYRCAAGSCAKPCATSADCLDAYFCSGTGDCSPKGAQGAPCSSAGDCTSGFCVDGVCCDKACEGACYACAAAKKQSNADDGKCDPAASGTDPHDNCTKSPVSSCASDGECDGQGSCRLYADGTTCGPTSCSTDHTTLTEQACNGWGDCVASSSSCAPQACENGACVAIGCTDDADCADGYFCNMDTCEPKVANGAPCGSASACTSGFCVDGVCCDAACAGQCEACDNAGDVGTCSPSSGAPHGGRPACAGSGPCAGSCGGTSRSECVFAGSAVECGTDCSDGAQTTSTCDGHGACAAGTPVPCSPYVCGDDGACKTSCAGDTDCQTPATCSSSGSCEEEEADAAPGPDAAGTGGSGAPPTPAATQEDSGCGCELPASNRKGSAVWLMIAGALTLVLRWKRNSAFSR